MRPPSKRQHHRRMQQMLAYEIDDDRSKAKDGNGERRGRKRGRKPGKGRRPVARTPRATLASHHPVHITVRLMDGLPSLRSKEAYQALLDAFRAGRDRFGFRSCHFSIQTNHIHLVVEAEERVALSRGMQGLLIRVAKGLNKLWSRKGSLFSDRYHAHILSTPTEVRNALCYVLNNARKHRLSLPWPIDLFSSAMWFDGFIETLKGWRSSWDAAIQPIAAAMTWLLSVGWQRGGGLLDPAAVPGGRP